MLRVGINGIRGRMGQIILDFVLDSGHLLGAAFEHGSCPDIGKDISILIPKIKPSITINTINENDFQNIDGIIDFTLPISSMEILDIAIKTNTPLVLGTTGFSDIEISKIEEASKHIPILFSPNMSVGVNLLFKLTEIVSKTLNSGFDVEIFEAHHRFKKDAPSGTAKKLVDIVKNSINELADTTATYDRTGRTNERADNEIGVSVMRGGDIVGEHTVYFAGMGERIELTHRATSRQTFARGAVIGLEYIVGKTPKLYSMFDVLGI